MKINNIKRYIYIFSIIIISIILFKKWAEENYVNNKKYILHDNIAFKKNKNINNKNLQYKKKTIKKYKNININNKYIIIKINNINGEIENIKLKKYKLLNKQDLINVINKKTTYIKNGFIINNKIISIKYIKKKIFKKQNKIILYGITNTHILIKKIFIINKYTITTKYILYNPSNKIYKIQFFNYITNLNVYKHKNNIFSPNYYNGISISTNNIKYKQIEYNWLKKNTIHLNTYKGWIASINRYFINAIILKNENIKKYYYNYNNKYTYIIGYYTENINIKKHTKINLNNEYYCGPKIIKLLKKVHKNLEFNVNYGMLWYFSYLIFIIMNSINNYTNNWGVSIILTTTLIKIIFYKISKLNYESTYKIQNIYPKLEKIKKKFSHDKKKLNLEIIKLYKKYKINPASGCLSILIQIPFFISIYYVIINSIEIRQAKFLWINDLSIKDYTYILPILVGITIFIQQYINPNKNQNIKDNIQQIIMYILPIILTLTFINFPAGLNLYWLINNIITIMQQLYIKNFYENKKNK